jgi:hypothetical protein
MYSAAPTNTTSGKPTNAREREAPPHHPRAPPSVSLSMTLEDLSLDPAGAGRNGSGGGNGGYAGNGYDDDFDQVIDEMREEEPFGANVEHACRWV